MCGPQVESEWSRNEKFKQVLEEAFKESKIDAEKNKHLSDIEFLNQNARK